MEQTFTSEELIEIETAREKLKKDPVKMQAWMDWCTAQDRLHNAEAALEDVVRKGKNQAAVRDRRIEAAKDSAQAEYLRDMERVGLGAAQAEVASAKKNLEEKTVVLEQIKK